MVLGLNMDLADFTQEKQGAFLRGFADAVGVPRDRARITDISSRDTTQRRLLAAGIRVSAEAVVAGEEQGASAVTQLTPDLLNAKMGQYGLSGIEVLQGAAVATVRVARGAVSTTPPPTTTPTPAPFTGGSLVHLSIAAGPFAEGDSVSWGRKHAPLLAAIICAIASAVLFGIVCVVVFARGPDMPSQTPRPSESAQQAQHMIFDHSYQNVPCLHCHNLRSMHAAL
jgi:hypothetical protein